MTPQPLIDDVNKIMELSEDELNELLIHNKYNKANLRELLRRTLASTKEYKKVYEYERTVREQKEEQLESCLNKVKQITEQY
jgi:hypothetical protein